MINLAHITCSFATSLHRESSEKVRVRFRSHISSTHGQTKRLRGKTYDQSSSFSTTPLLKFPLIFNPVKLSFGVILNYGGDVCPGGGVIVCTVKTRGFPQPQIFGMFFEVFSDQKNNFLFWIVQILFYGVCSWCRAMIFSGIRFTDTIHVQVKAKAWRAKAKPQHGGPKCCSSCLC